MSATEKGGEEAETSRGWMLGVTDARGVGSRVSLFFTCTGRDECCAWPAASAAAPSGSQGTSEGGAHTRNVHCVAQRRWRSGHCGHIDWDAGNLRPQLANKKAHHRSQFALNQPPVMPTKPRRLDGRAPHSRNALTPSPKTKDLRQIHHRGRNLCHRR